MKILQIAPLEESVPPKRYGGTELVVHNLTEELVKRGHEVYLLAAGDSVTSAELVPIFPRGLRDYPDAQSERARDIFKFVAVDMFIKTIGYINPDIVHNHFGWRMLIFSDFITCPMVTTLHKPLNNGRPETTVYKIFRRLNYVSVSNSQRLPLPDLNYLGTAHNGIDISQFDFSEKRGEYVAFLGSMFPEKGPLQAIEAAKKAGVKLIMAAKVDVGNKLFFDTKVAPHIDGKQVEFIGEIGPKEKRDFLKNASALLAPVQWDEPFGLYFAEAMASGTPVIAFDRGSVKEVVGPGGFICDPEDHDCIFESIKKIYSMPPADYGRLRHLCRERAENNFNVAKMADNYEKIYAKILK